MKFQLVLQFPATEMKQFDELVALEEDLIQTLPPNSQVDGHDFGSGEFNIFIYTNQPGEIFGIAWQRILRTPYHGQLRAAYRDRKKDEYVILWPEHLEHFKVA